MHELTNAKGLYRIFLLPRFVSYLYGDRRWKNGDGIVIVLTIGFIRTPKFVVAMILPS
jgi:hypothetical protein